MILEVATLPVRAGQEAEFEAAFATAQALIASIPGYLSHELLRGLDDGVTSQYVLLVRWETVAAHTIGFRQSPQYQDWRGRLHHFYHPAPTVFHYGTVAGRDLA